MPLSVKIQTQKNILKHLKKYKIEFTPRSDSDTPGSSMGFMFNPIKANGEWVLAIKDGRQPSREAATPLHDDAPAPVDVIVEK